MPKMVSVYVEFKYQCSQRGRAVVLLSAQRNTRFCSTRGPFRFTGTGITRPLQASLCAKSLEWLSDSEEIKRECTDL